MTAEEVLRSNEESALENNQIVSSVTGRSNKRGSFKMKKGFGAAIFITLMIVVFVIFFSVGNLIPAAISERLIEETDVQYADAVQTKIYVFQSALSNGTVPSNTVERLKNAGVIVGNGPSDNFTESTSGTSLKIGDKVITAAEFSDAVMSNATLYDAFNSATYGRAAYYYDDAAQTVFKNLGASRNNYKDEEKSFEEVMADAVGEGSNIKVSGVEKVERERKDANGKTILDKYGNPIMEEDYEQVGLATSGDASAFISQVSSNSKSLVGGTTTATMNAANTLTVADSIAKQQKSSSFYLAFMENISKMKAGYGSESKINEAMNYLYQETESEVIDVKTGETIKVTGSMLESPSLYAILSGEKLDVNNVENYSSERILKTIENKLPAGTRADSGVTLGSVTSTGSKITASIGRLFGWFDSDDGVLQTVSDTVNSSLVDNSFDTIYGVKGGEMLVEGAVNVGASLALMSGASVGDGNAVKQYARVNETILALDAEVDRMHRSPLDITSKNTFLGSLVYKFAVSTVKSGTILNKLASLSKVAASSISSLLPTTRADDENISYMTNSGDCEILNNIGAVGTASCARSETFDMSTLDDLYNNPAGYEQFLSNNALCDDDNNCEIIENSYLANYIDYNTGRITPVGVTDGGILEALQNGANGNKKTVSFFSGIVDMIRRFIGADEPEKNIASGAVFVNSSSNSEWQNYKYAQRYLSLNRAINVLRKYDGDETAYSDIPGVGIGNPVLAYINRYNNDSMALSE